MRLREWHKDLLLGLGSFALAMLAAEVVLRIAWRPESQHTVIEQHAVYGWALRPGSSMHSVASDRGLDYHIHVNALGLRDRERDRTPSKGTRRVLFLGDSVVFGAGVEAADRCTDRLERALGPGVEVVNAAVSGWGPDQEYLWLVHDGFALHPDVVVLGLCMLNDVLNVLLPHELFGAAPKPHFVLENGSLELIPAAPRPPATRSQKSTALLKHSRLLHFVGRHARLLRERTRPKPALAANMPYYPEDLENDASHWSVFKTPYSPRFENAFEVTEALIGAIRDSCAARGVPFVLVAIPNRVEVDAAARDRELRHFEYEAAWFDLDAPYDRLRSLTARLGVPFIYPRESFLDVEQHERLFFPRDGHPNARGHALVAAAVEPTLHDILTGAAWHSVQR